MSNNKPKKQQQVYPKSSKEKNEKEHTEVYTAATAVKYGWTDYLIFDITFWFTMAVMFLPCALVYPDTKRMMVYLYNPTFWGAYVYLFLVLLVTHLFGKTKVLSGQQQRIANWFLCNGVFYNCFLDVFAGQFQIGGLMTEQYNKLEPRYLYGLTNDLPAGQTVFMTSMLELFIQGPLCLLTYWGFYHNASWRYVTGIIVSVLHICGTWYMYIPEILLNFPHVPADTKFRFSFDDIIYFWFGFCFCSLLWTIIPLTMIFKLSSQSQKK